MSTKTSNKQNRFSSLSLDANNSNNVQIAEKELQQKKPSKSQNSESNNSAASQPQKISQTQKFVPSTQENVLPTPQQKTLDRQKLQNTIGRKHKAYQTSDFPDPIKQYKNTSAKKFVPSVQENSAPTPQQLALNKQKISQSLGQPPSTFKSLKKSSQTKKAQLEPAIPKSQNWRLLPSPPLPPTRRLPPPTLPQSHTPTSQQNAQLQKAKQIQPTQPQNIAQGTNASNLLNQPGVSTNASNLLNQPSVSTNASNLLNQPSVSTNASNLLNQPGVSTNASNLLKQPGVGTNLPNLQEQQQLLPPLPKGERIQQPQVQPVSIPNTYKKSTKNSPQPSAPPKQNVVYGYPVPNQQQLTQGQVRYPRINHLSTNQDQQQQQKIQQNYQQTLQDFKQKMYLQYKNLNNRQVIDVVLVYVIKIFSLVFFYVSQYYVYQLFVQQIIKAKASADTLPNLSTYIRNSIIALTILQVIPVIIIATMISRDQSKTFNGQATLVKIIGDVFFTNIILYFFGLSFVQIIQQKTNNNYQDQPSYAILELTSLLKSSFIYIAFLPYFSVFYLLSSLNNQS